MVLLCREPFSGITPLIYPLISDRNIVALLSARWDENGYYVPECRSRQPRTGELTGSPENAGRELPSMAELQVPDEVLAPDGPPMAWSLMFYQCWRGRGLTAEETLAKWREAVGKLAAAR